MWTFCLVAVFLSAGSGFSGQSGLCEVKGSVRHWDGRGGRRAEIIMTSLSEPGLRRHWWVTPGEPFSGGVERGRWRYEARGVGCSIKVGDIDTSNFDSILIGEVVLTVGATLSGVVRSALGVGLEGARVLVWQQPELGVRFPCITEVVCDSQGEFEVPHVAPGPAFVWALHERHALMWPSLIHVQDGEKVSVDLHMEMPCTIHITCIDFQGAWQVAGWRPIDSDDRGWRVRGVSGIGSGTGPAPALPWFDVGVEDQLSELYRASIRLPEDGQVRIPRLAPGTYRISVAGYGMPRFTTDCVVAPGETKLIMVE